MAKLSMEELVNSRQMCHYLGMIMANWDESGLPKENPYHDCWVGYQDVAWVLAWAAMGQATYDNPIFKDTFDFVFHDIKDNYEFDEDAVPHVEFWKEQLKED